MIFLLINYIFFFFKKKNSLVTKSRILFLIILPNFFKIIKKEVFFEYNFPKVQQRTFFTGNGKVTIGQDCKFGFKLGGFHYGGSIELQPRYIDSKIVVGNRVSINNNVFICAANYIKIGNDTLIGQNLAMMDHEAHGIEPNNRRKLGVIGKIIIGRSVWIGNNVTILKNSSIGDNTIIAAGAIVSGTFPSNVIIGGIPAKIIRKIDDKN